MVTPAHLWWCLAGLGLALAPHGNRVAFGILACASALATWRMLGAYGHLPLPDRTHRALWWLKQLLALAAFSAIYVAYRGQIGRDAGVALLAALLGLKFLEMERPRDFYVVSFLTYFLVVTNFFYSQTVPTALYMLVVVILVTAGLIRFNAPPSAFATTACLRLALRMVTQALPIMVLAFLLFPRVPGPLWGLPQDAFSAVTGLSDTMTIGHITSLGTSDEIAFRVKFENDLPRAAERYWRGPVLWETDGRTWRTGNHARGDPPAVIKQGPTYRYSILLEPTGERWLLGLDAVTHSGPIAIAGADQTLYTRQPVKKRLHYTLDSATHYQLREISAAQRLAALSLPAGQHPRALALGREWRTVQRTPDAIVQSALDFFRHENFVYTLLPPALPHDSVDQFLFESRAGFCEHYAASFVVLMRAAGIPARVVTGYQGGEFNDVSDYLIIRQRDAHAWAEVYLPVQGWTRVDPTSIVAPARLSLGINSVTGERSPLAIIDRNATALKAFRRVAALWDAMNYQWSQWVLGYSPQRQLEFFRHLGLDDVDFGDMTLALTGSIVGFIALLAILTLRTIRPLDPVIRSYRRFCDKLARLGYSRAPHEGPHDYALRVSAARPDLAPQVEHITKLYTALRYADARVDPGLLRRAVSSFVPKQRSRTGTQKGT